MSTDPVESQMVSALELLHYGNRFRGQLFVLALEDHIKIDSIITDLRVLQAAQINLVMICTASKDLASELDVWNQRGTRMRYITDDADHVIQSARSRTLQETLRDGIIPVLAISSITDEGTNPVAISSNKDRVWSTTERTLLTIGALVAEQLRATKLFVVSNIKCLEIDGKLHSHPDPTELEGILENSEKLANTSLNIPPDKLAFLLETNKRTGIEVALLEGKSGVLFQETFSHRGKGTLFTRQYPHVIRRGRPSDVTEILMLMRPYMVAGIILPTSEDEIAKDVDDFFLYTVNGALVGLSKLVDYAEATELAKFSTLPRFQGKGRARQLAQLMIEESKKMGKQYVFALSIEPKMWQFFESMGFREVPRETLPELWKHGYDFSRSSRAFRLDID